jgi:hypothetical protein
MINGQIILLENRDFILVLIFEGQCLQLLEEENKNQTITWYKSNSGLGASITAIRFD